MGILESALFWKGAAVLVTAIIGAVYGRKELKAAREDKQSFAKSLARTCYFVAEALAAAGKIKETPAGTLAEMKRSRAISEFVAAWTPIYGAEPEKVFLDIAKSEFSILAALGKDLASFHKALMD